MLMCVRDKAGEMKLQRLEDVTAVQENYSEHLLVLIMIHLCCKEVSLGKTCKK